MADKTVNYTTLFMFLRALEKAYKWKEGHYFIPVISIIPDERFPAYKTVKIIVEEVKSAIGEIDYVHRFTAQSVINSTIINRGYSYQKAINDVIEEMMRLMIEHYGNVV